MTLNWQVKRREDVIKRLKMEHVNMQEANSRFEEKVRAVWFYLICFKVFKIKIVLLFFLLFFFDKFNVMRALSLDKSNGEGTRSDEDALENQSIRGMVYIITLSLSLFISLFLCNIFLCFTAGHQAWNYHQSRT